MRKALLHCLQLSVILCPSEADQVETDFPWACLPKEAFGHFLDSHAGVTNE